jgi:D-alanine--D-alanine ligase
MSTDVLNRNKIKVAVLRGGPSGLYDISLDTGANVLKNLPERFIPHDVLISRDGNWHIAGVNKSPERILGQVDVVWNALHGQYGEDGKVQKILESFGVPYTGSNTLSSAMGLNKELSKKIFLSHGYKTPTYLVLRPNDNTYEKILELFQTFPQPSVVKPLHGGSSYGITMATDLSSLKRGIEKAFRHGGAVLLEEYIAGKETTCSVLNSVSGKGSYSFSPVKTAQSSDSVSEEEKLAMQNMASTLHRVFNLRHYSTFDFIVSPKRGIYILEVNTQPSLSSNSPFFKSLEMAGLTMEDFLDHVLTLALQK